MSGHTQGPWHAHPSALGLYVSASPSPGPGPHIASCSGERAAANAKLMSAAPEMAEALQRIVEWMSDERLTNRACFELSLAALKKAGLR